MVVVPRSPCGRYVRVELATIGGSAMVSEGRGKSIRMGVLDGDVLAQRGLQSVLAKVPDIELVSQMKGIDEVNGSLLADLDLLLVALETVTVSGRDAMTFLTELSGEVTVLVISTKMDPELVVACLKAGSAGFIWKGVDPGIMVQGARAAVAGGHPIHPPIAGDLLFHVLSGGSRRNKGCLGLTNREQEVLALLAKGMSNKEIAVALGLSVRTVKAHVSNILQKLGVADRTQAAVMAVRIGLDTGENEEHQSLAAASWPGPA